MGCHVMFLSELADRGLWPRGARVLDFGTQRLLGDPDAVCGFVDRVAAPEHAGSAELAQHLDRVLSATDAAGNPRLVDLADVLRPAGVDYVAFDVCPGTATRYFDLNADHLDAADRSVFDVVLNFGTTEHLLGQDHAFRVAHEAMKPGGVCYHQLPCVGYLGHGYVSYHPLLFRDLAEANGYDVIAMWLTGPQGAPDRLLLDQFEDEPDLAPAGRADCQPEAWRQLTQRDGVLNVILRKPSDAPFRRPLEVRTASQHELQRAADEAGSVPVSSVPIHLSAGRDLTRVPLRVLLREVGHRLGRKLRHPLRGSTVR